MIGPDWGAYLAGEMSEVERAELERLLASDESARRDLEGFRAFLGGLKEAALREPIPREELERALRRTVPERRRTISRLNLVGAAACVLALAYLGFGLITRDPMSFNTSASRERLATRSAREASIWLRSKTPLAPPQVDLSPLAELVGAQYGDGWACYDYKGESGSYYLYFRGDDSKLRQGKQGELAKHRVWIGKGIGWKGRSVSCYLRGGDAATRAKLAGAAIEQTLRS